MRPFRQSLCLLLFATALAAEDIAWGEAAAGLRVGIACAKTQVTVDHQPLFTVILENVTGAELTIPAPASYVAKTHERVTGYFVRPLQPVIEIAHGQKETYSISGGDDLASVSKALRVLKAHETLTLADMPLTAFSYTEGHPDYGNKTAAKRNALRSDSSYRVHFAFENENAELTGTKAWTGTATSGAITIDVARAPAPEGIEAAFSVDGAEFGLYRPIYTTFTVTNHGPSKVSFATGGDYQFLGRHERFSFKAVDENGQPVPDPIAQSLAIGGGIGGNRSIEPGATYTERVLVNQWCAFSKPGKYVLTCTRTLNFAPSPSINWDALMPTLPIETKLTITIRKDDTLAAYLEQLPERYMHDTRNEARDELGALAHARVAEALPVIADFLKNRQLNLPKRQDIIRWLGLYGKDFASEALRQAATADDALTRYLALKHLAEWNDPNAAALILKALSSPDDEERQSAVDLCSKHKPDGCFATLLTMADDKNKIVRRYLSAALAKYDDKAALPVLLKLLKDSDTDPFISIWAAGALGKFGRHDGIPVLIALLKDPRTPNYRGNIVMTLEQLTGQKLREDFAEWNAWWEKAHERFENP